MNVLVFVCCEFCSKVLTSTVAAKGKGLSSPGATTRCAAPWFGDQNSATALKVKSTIRNVNLLRTLQPSGSGCLSKAFDAKSDSSQK